MADPVTLTLIGSLVGIGTSVGGQIYNTKKSQEVAKVSRRQEDIRQKQMQMEALQKRRQIIRNSQLAKATAASNLASQGVSIGSSAYSVLDNITAQSLIQQGDLQRNLNDGEEMFSLNAQASEAGAQQTLGANVAGFGKNIFASSEAIGRVGSTLLNNKSSY